MKGKSMEKKKIKLWKKILILIVLILLILLVIVFYRYNILTTLQEKNYIYNEKSNCYYYSESDNTIMEYWKKDGIIKLNTRQLNGNGNITFWLNTNTNEEYIFWNEPEKYYSEEEGVTLKRLPQGMMFAEDAKVRLMMAVYPGLYIGSQKYEGKDCYKIKIGEQEEFIEKETGLVLYSSNGENRKITYSFDCVTNEDIKMPDINEYKLIENK